MHDLLFRATKKQTETSFLSYLFITYDTGTARVKKEEKIVDAGVEVRFVHQI